MRKVLAILCLAALLLAGCGKEVELPQKQDIPAPTDAPTVPPTQAPTEPPVTEPQPMSVPDLAEYVQNRAVTVHAVTSYGTSTGSGFFIDDQGTVVTNYHVIDAAEELSAEIKGGGKYNVVKIIDFSEMLDIAILKVDISGNDYLELAEEAPRTGETVYAVGSALGFLNDTFTNGIISSTNRMVGVIECIQTTAAISSGNSGGPLVNEFGKVVGINAFTYTSGDSLHLAVKIGELNNLTKDKNWTISQYKEWYKKEIDRSYQVWNYTTKEWELSKIHTYQHVTGQTCFGSAMDWSFLEGDFENVVDGYDDSYGVYFYTYDVNEFDAYTEYLNSIGFVFSESKDYTEGISYFYENEFSGHCMDIFIMAGDEYVIVEPYCN